MSRFKGVLSRVEVELKDVIRLGTIRGLDFVILDELQKRTGIAPREVLKFALGEMLCNALDKTDATEIHTDIRLPSLMAPLESTE